ncbi:hypothetical protein V7S43_015751 [Phytophthora oleae]|uniref:GxxExxY protein n=1 Tax=Phytophthora oleae TaxID=2107226 RepID=A0ABD3EY36_9STRA
MNTRSQSAASFASATDKPSRDRGNTQDEHEQDAESKVHDISELTENLHKISFGEPKKSIKNLPKITTRSQLKDELPAICDEVFQVLGPYNLEATYQRALALELENRGVTVRSEVEISIEYKGQKIATRRVDLYLELDKAVILELKAVVGLKAEHTKQLKFYMTHFDVSEGYLINFPHITGFPEENTVQYVDHPLQGPPVSDVVTRSKTRRTMEETPNVIHVKQLKKTKKTVKKEH